MLTSLISANERGELRVQANQMTSFADATTPTATVNTSLYALRLNDTL